MADKAAAQELEDLAARLRERAAQCRDWAEVYDRAAEALDTRREVERTGELRADVSRALKLVKEGEEILKRFS